MKFGFKNAFLQLLIAAISFTSPAQSQKTTINGKVTSFEESLPLEGVRVAVKDSKVVAGTQADGTFSLEVTAADKILFITLQGYEKQEIKITTAHDYNIVLIRSGSSLASKDLAATSSFSAELYFRVCTFDTNNPR